jgi:hypothetical protein
MGKAAAVTLRHEASSGHREALETKGRDHLLQIPPALSYLNHHIRRISIVRKPLWIQTPESRFTRSLCYNGPQVSACAVLSRLWLSF